MITLYHTKDQKYVVFGLGRSGLATALSLRAGGARVIVGDDNEAGRASADKLGFKSADLMTFNWQGVSALVLSPGIAHNLPEPHPVARLAREKGVPIIGDGELFARERRHKKHFAPIIAITGTNGKSTTSALTAHFLARHGVTVALGGNIGRPMLDLPELDAQSKTCYVLEISSFQSELAPSLAPEIGLITNLSPDHLDRHGSMDCYAAVKAGLLGRSKSVVVGMDDEFCQQIYYDNAPIKKALAISRNRLEAADYYYDQKAIWSRESNSGGPLLSLAAAHDLRGAHNGQNTAAALAVAGCFLDNDRVFSDQDVNTYQGLPHRLQFLGTAKGVDYYNDSKATNGLATATAVQSFEQVYLILGGVAKADGLNDLKPYFERIKKAYLIGEAAAKFAATLEGKVPFVLCHDLTQAFHEASREAGRNRHEDKHPSILLSPAAASFDQFKHFEHRGDVFVDLFKQELTACRL